jgi:general secretion pathway protein F
MDVALRRLSPPLDEASLALVRLGEERGDLSGALWEIESLHRHSLPTEHLLQRAIRHFAFGIIVSMSLLAIPVGFTLVFSGLRPWARLIDSFEELGAELPSITLVAIHLTQPPVFLTLWCIVAAPILMAFALVLLWLSWSQGPVSAGVRRRQGPRISALRPTLDLDQQAQWTHWVGGLMARGCTVAHAVDLLEDTVRTRTEKEKWAALKQHLKGGASLHEALTIHGFFSPEIAASLGAANRRGELAAGLQRVAIDLHRRAAHRCRAISPWLDPAGMALALPVVLLLGGFLTLMSLCVVGFVLPLFTIPRLLG